ncbi:MAG: iron-siderophore ABC transporter substrate-binding protein [Candidatus Limiplasma sp.]|nr:iron-siderophore ABC transporter substrate-binding protein [Candidatus Limiplasma sp.]
MMKWSSSKLLSVALALLLTLTTAGGAALAADASAATYPLTIPHALGETVLQAKPERVVAISWGNPDVPLALGIAPVGVSKANYGIGAEESLLPWTLAGFAAVGVDAPTVFDDVDGLDYEAINDAQPDVILAAYSGLTQEEYDKLSDIAPVVAYPGMPWQTGWREQIVLNATAMGMQAEGEAVVAELETYIAARAAQYPALAGKRAAFFWFSPDDLGNTYIYTLSDPRAAYLLDLGMTFPESVNILAGGENTFAIQVSAENFDQLSDVDVILTYGDAGTLAALQADPLASAIPAIRNGAVAVIQNNSYLAASCTPSALSIPATLDAYLALIAEAAEKAQ